MQTRRSSRINRESDEFIVVNDYFNNNDKLDSSNNILNQMTKAVNDIGVNTDDQLIKNKEGSDKETNTENITIERCLDGFYDNQINFDENNTENNTENVVMDIESSLNYYSYEASKSICNMVFNCLKKTVSKSTVLLKYPLLFAFVVVISSLMIGYFTFIIIDNSYNVGFATKCNYFPEEKRCLYNVPLAIINPFEYHRNFVRKNTYIRFTDKSLEYWNPWMHKKIIKIDNHHCTDYICNINNVINNNQLVIVVNNTLNTINNKVIDKYNDINQITIINDNKWIPIDDIESDILRSLTEKMFELKEGKTEIYNTTHLTSTQYTHIYTLFTLVSVSTYIFIMM
tara:strand:- start:581 stop:1606 length:1026 start_codon:yes stop_codon:yes gene_type:complete